MDRPTLRALLLAAAVVTPTLVASAVEPKPPIKHAEELSAKEIREALRAKNGTTYEGEPPKEGPKD